MDNIKHFIKFLGAFVLAFTIMTATGCGTNNSSGPDARGTNSNADVANGPGYDEIRGGDVTRTTLSEALNTDGGIIFYSTETIDKDNKPTIYYFCNNRLTTAWDTGLTFGELSRMTDEEIIVSLGKAKQETFLDSLESSLDMLEIAVGLLKEDPIGELKVILDPLAKELERIAELLADDPKNDSLLDEQRALELQYEDLLYKDEDLLYRAENYESQLHDALNSICEENLLPIGSAELTFSLDDEIPHIQAELENYLNEYKVHYKNIIEGRTPIDTMKLLEAISVPYYINVITDSSGNHTETVQLLYGSVQFSPIEVFTEATVRGGSKIQNAFATGEIYEATYIGFAMEGGIFVTRKTQNSPESYELDSPESATVFVDKDESYFTDLLKEEAKPRTDFIQ